MNRIVVVVMTAAGVVSTLGAQTACAQGAKPAAERSTQPAAGHKFVHDGVTLYYEIYGTGNPLLLVHGNGGSIEDFRAQINHFRKHYQVVAVDSRDHGRSSPSSGRLTYENMTDDLAALVDHLRVGPVNVLGWSDGGIQALLLGIRHPAKVKKIAVMGANLNPDDDAVHANVIAMARSAVTEMSTADTALPEIRRQLKLTRLLLDEPHIEMKALERITVPTLVMAADNDVIRLEHTVQIYAHLPQGELAIFPGSTHMVPFDNPAVFNSTVEHFLRTPFVKKDRIKDMIRSIETMRAPRN